ncbi:MAG: hypothetical protein V1726_03555 [Methanobacteriota archaeon]
MVKIFKGMYARNNYAVSEVVGILLILTITSSVISATLYWAGDRLNEEKNEQSAVSGLNQFVRINDVFQETIAQGVNSSKTMNFVTKEGYVHMGSRGTRFVFAYSVNRTCWFNVSELGDDDDYNFTIALYNESMHCGLEHFDCFDIRYLNNGTRIAIDSIVPPPPILSHPVPPEPGVPPKKVVIETDKALYDAVQINMYNASLNTSSGLWTYYPVGKIFLFDSGYLSYEIPGYQSTNRIILENGGTIFANPSAGYLQKIPVILHVTGYSGDRFLYSIIQLKPKAETVTGPGGNYKFVVKLTNISIRAFDDVLEHYANYSVNPYYHRLEYHKIQNHSYRGTDVNFRIQIFGENAGAWKEYFMSSRFYQEGSFFLENPSDETLYINCYPSGYGYEFSGFRFFLTQYVYEVTLENI